MSDMPSSIIHYFHLSPNFDFSMLLTFLVRMRVLDKAMLRPQEHQLFDETVYSFPTGKKSQLMPFQWLLPKGSVFETKRWCQVFFHLEHNDIDVSW